MTRITRGRRQFLESALGTLAGVALGRALGGCAVRADGPGSDDGALSAGGIPSAAELVASESARTQYKQILAGIFGTGLPQNTAEMSRLTAGMGLSQSGAVGHYAWTIPGDSIEHIKQATAYWGEVLKVGPFFVMESDANVQQDYYPIDGTTKKRADDAHRQRLAWPVLTAVCKGHRDYYVEINCQTKDTPSTYRDMYTSDTGGIHHFAVFTRAFKQDKAIVEARYSPSTTLVTPLGTTYYDARGDVGAMLELLETNEYLDFMFRSSYALSTRADPKSYAPTFNIQPADVTKPKAQRGLTVPRFAMLVQWAMTEGPLAGTGP